MAFFNRCSDDSAAAGLHDVAADDRVFSPVRTFDEDVWSDRRDDLVRRLLIENGDGVHACECGENFGTLGFRSDRPIRSLDRSDGAIGVDADNQRVAERPRVLQVTDMAGVQQVEDAVGEDDGFASCPSSAHEFDGLGHGEGACQFQDFRISGCEDSGISGFKDLESLNFTAPANDQLWRGR
jgi:hypothetical protein